MHLNSNLRPRFTPKLYSNVVLVFLKNILLKKSNLKPISVPPDTGEKFDENPLCRQNSSHDKKQNKIKLFLAAGGGVILISIKASAT